MEKEYIKASEYAKKMSLNVRTVYRYYHNGKIKGYQDKETGTIFILNPFKRKNEDNLENKVVLYARVSSSENKTNLESQLERLRLFASAKGYQIVKEIKDIVSDEIQRQIVDGTFVKNYDEGTIEFTDEQLEETLQEFSENGWDSEEIEVVKDAFENYNFEEEEEVSVTYKDCNGGIDWYDTGETRINYFEMKKVGGK